MRTVLLVDGIGYGDRHRFLVAGYAHRVVVVALQAGQRERLVRVGQPVGGHHLHGHGRVDAHGEQTHYELFPVRGNSDRIGYGRCREVLLGVDRTGGRQYVAVGLQDDFLGRFVRTQSERDLDAGHQRFEREVYGQLGRRLVDFERLLPDVRIHEVIGSQVVRAVFRSPGVLEGLVHGVERGVAVVRIISRRQRVGADGHVARERRGRARLVGRELACHRRGSVVEEHGDFVAGHPVGRGAVDGSTGLPGNHLLGDGYLDILFRAAGRSRIVLAARGHADRCEHCYNE